MVGCRRLPAAVESPVVMAVRRRLISVRTRVRLAGLTSARWRDCAARFKTDFFFFLTLVACPWAIYCSFCVSLKLLTLNEAHGFVKRAEKVGGRWNRRLRRPFVCTNDDVSEYRFIYLIREFVRVSFFGKLAEAGVPATCMSPQRFGLVA